VVQDDKTFAMIEPGKNISFGFFRDLLVHVIDNQYIVVAGGFRPEQRVRIRMHNCPKNDVGVVAEELKEWVMLEIMATRDNQNSDFTR